MTAADENSAARRKRILWRATHRGIKEMDLIFGGFVRQHLASFSEAELDQLERLIALPDQDMLAWATRQVPVPAAIATPLLFEMLFGPSPSGEGGARAAGVGG